MPVIDMIDQTYDCESRVFMYNCRYDKSDRVHAGLRALVWNNKGLIGCLRCFPCWRHMGEGSGDVEADDDHARASGGSCCGCCGDEKAKKRKNARASTTGGAGAAAVGAPAIPP